MSEALECRQLLSAVAADGFESGDFDGGTEQWAEDAGWSASGDATVRTDGPNSGSYHARLRRSTGDLQRTVDVSGLTDVQLQFSARLRSFEGSDQAHVQVSGDGVGWTTLQTFVNGQDDNQYHDYSLAVPDVGDTLFVRFDAAMSGSGDYWYLDDISVTGEPAIATVVFDPAKPVKIFVMAGQSNMTGTARVENLDPAWNSQQDDVAIWLDHDMDGGQWTTLGPGHGLGTHAPRPDEPEGLDPRSGLGPELSLGRVLADAYPDHQIVLIKHGDGGRDLASDFDPENTGPPESNDHMWSGLLEKTDDALTALDAAGPSYEFAGFFLAIGGGDARNRNSESTDPDEFAAGEAEALQRSAQYGENLTNFIAAVRDEFSPELPFIMSRIKDDLTPELLENYPGADLVRQAQLDVAASDAWTEVFTTDGITLRDAVHFDAMGQIEHGTRFAYAYLDLVTSSPLEIAISDAVASEGGTDWAFAESFETDEQPFSYTTWDIARSENGDHYATTILNGEDSGIMRIDGETGELDAEFVAPGTAGLNKARELTIYEDWIYVSNKTTNEVLRFDLATGAPDPAGAFVSTGDAGLTTPRGLAFDAGGNLLVVSADTNEILKFDPQGDFVEVFASGITDTNTPKDLTIDGSGNVFVAGDQRVYQYSSAGSDLGVFADAGTSTTSVEFGPDGNLYVANGANGGILRFDGLTGDLIDVIANDAFGEKQGMAFDDAGSVFVANHPGDTQSARVLRYARSSADTFVVSLSSPSDQPIMVEFTTADITATAGSDYVAGGGTLVFEPGVTTRTIVVPTIDDSEIEADETFVVNLSNPTGGATIVDPQGVGTIISDDVAPNVLPVAYGGGELRP